MLPGREAVPFRAKFCLPVGSRHLRLTLLHSNDIHGRQDRIGQIATLVRREKATADHQVIYLDAGDVEDTSNRLSSMTKGSAMHRLLSHAGCDAATVGNGGWQRYGPQILAEHARAATYPLLLANFQPMTGPVPSVLLGEVGVFGLTAAFRHDFADTDWGWEPLDELQRARGVARNLRATGAGLVVLLSHLGLDTPQEPWDDRRLAAELQDDIDLIVGAHSHDLLPHGELVGNVLIAQAGEFGEHLGRIEIDGDRITATVTPVSDETEQHPAVAREAALIEEAGASMLAEQIGHLDRPLDATWIAEMLRRRMQADVGLFSHGQTLGVVPAGRITRGALWAASDTPANPGVTTMTGVQLSDLIRRGNDLAFVLEKPRALRGLARGRLCVSGVEPDRIDPARSYLVAATDWELETYGGYTRVEWNLRMRYDFPIIIREAIEESLIAGQDAASVETDGL